MENSIESINNRFDQEEDRICELEDQSFEIIQSEKQKEKKRMERVKKAYGNDEIPSKKQNMHYRNPRRRRERNGKKKSFEAIMAEISQT